MPETADLQNEAREVRNLILQMAAGPEGAHLGGALSAADILTALYHGVMRIDPEHPSFEARDYFIMSKGHSAAALYSVLARRGFFPVTELATYARKGSRLAGHPLRKVPGIEFPTGSLGHGLSLGVGMALAAQRDGRANRTFVLLGDGELQEGSVWEAALSASRFRLGSLCAIVDRNRLQINGNPESWLPFESLEQRWQSFGWATVVCNGHDIGQVTSILNAFRY